MKLTGKILATLILLALLPVLLSAAMVGLASTESGSVWLFETAAKWLPGELKSGQFQGILLKRFELHQFSYALPPYQIAVDRFILDWRPGELRRKSLTIKEISAAHLHYQGPASEEQPPPAAPIRLPEIRLPVQITIDRADFEDILIQQGTTTVALQRLGLQATAQASAATIDELILKMAPLSASLKGRVDLIDDFPLDLDIAWSYLYENQTIEGQGHFGGTLKTVTVDHRLTAPFIVTTQGVIHPLQQPLAAELKGQWQNLRWPFKKPEYRSRQGQFQLTGSLDDYLVHLTTEAEVQTLPVTHLQLRGRGNLKQFQIQSARADTLDGQLDLQGSIAWEPQLQWQVTALGKQINPQALAPEMPGKLDFKIDSHGRWSPQGLMLEADIGQLRGHLRSQPVAGSGRVRFEKNQWDFQALDLKSGDNHLFVQGRLGDRINLDFNLDGRDLAAAWPGLSGQLTAQGRLLGTPKSPQIQLQAAANKIRYQDNRLDSLNLKVQFAPEATHSEASLRLGQLSLAGQKIHQLDLKAHGNLASHRLTLFLDSPPGQLQTALQGGLAKRRWSSRIDQLTVKDTQGKTLAFPDQGHLLAKVELDFNTEPIGLSGVLRAEIEDLSKLAQWLPQLDQPEGKITVDTTIGGNLGQPKLQGKLKVTNGAMGLKAAGIRLREINLTAASRDGGRFDIQGRLRSGEGQLNLSGWVRLPAADPLAMALTLQGNDLEVARLPQAQVNASPDLKFQLRHNQASLEGQVTIPKAKIKLKELPESAVSVSADEIIVGDAAPKRPTPFHLSSRLKIVVGDQVQFKGFGLKTRLQGQLNVKSRDGKTSAYGAILLKQGQYKAYGQELDIASGRLIFNGPVDNPYLELTAVRRIETEGITVTLQVKGPVSQPILTVASDPPMSNTDALAYLLTGRSLKSSNTDERTMIANAALSLGTSVVRPWLKQLGLDEMEVKTGESLEQTALTLGKYLTPDLYVGYALTLFNGQGAVLLRYQATRRIAIEAQSGSSQSLDVFYTLETD